MTEALVLGLALVAAEAAPPPPPALHWEKIHDRDGIAVFRSTAPGTSVLAFKGEGRVDAPLLKVAHVIIDPARGTEWVDSLAESRKIRAQGPFEFLEYDRFSMPLFVKDRDLVTRVTVEADVPARRVAVRFVSVEDAGTPPTARCVRAQLVHSMFELHDEGGAATLVKAEILCDPRGSLPKWLVNYFQKSWPVETLKALRRQSVRADVTEQPDLRRLWTSATSLPSSRSGP